MADRQSMRVRIGMAVVVVLALLRFVLVPWLDAQAQTRDRVSTLERTLASADGLQAHQEDLLERLAQYERAVSDLASRYHESADPRALQLTVQRYVEGLASEHGLTILRSDWGASGDGALVGAPLRLRFEGHLDDMLALVQALESGERFYRIQTMTVSKSPRGGSSAFDFVADVDLVAYVWRPAGAPATASESAS